MITPESFKQSLLKANILDPVGTHHEFAGGMHGRKLDFGKIDPRSHLYHQWVEVTVRKIYEIQDGRDLGKIALIGVANGTNCFAADVASMLEIPPLAVKTQKTSPKTVELTDEAKQQIQDFQPRAMFVLDDVGTEGYGTASAGQSAKEVSSSSVTVINTWQRQHLLKKLETAGIPYYAVINDELPTYTRQDCIDFGYCYDDWDLIEHE